VSHVPHPHTSIAFALEDAGELGELITSTLRVEQRPHAMQAHARVAALQLLTVSAEEVPTAMYLASLATWAAKVSALGAAEQPSRVRTAAYGALTALLRRGGGLLAVGAVRRELASALGKSVPPFLKRFQVRGRDSH
jgi:hypothetical protein